MKEKTGIKRTNDTLAYLYDWHTKLFPNVIEGISDQDAQNRLNSKANHVAWIAGSLVHGRYEIARIFGTNKKQNSDDLFKDFQGIQDGVTYPPLGEFNTEWESISKELRNSMVNLSSEDLAKPDPFEMPGKDLTLFDALAFMIDRESYAIGQIGILRRLLGYEAMKYPDE